MGRLGNNRELFVYWNVHHDGSRSNALQWVSLYILRATDTAGMDADSAASGGEMAASCAMAMGDYSGDRLAFA